MKAIQAVNADVLPNGNTGFARIRQASIAKQAPIVSFQEFLHEQIRVKQKRLIAMILQFFGSIHGKILLQSAFRTAATIGLTIRDMIQSF